MTHPQPGPTPSAAPDSRNWAMAAHLSALLTLLIPFASVIGPLVVWLIKKDQDPYVAEHAREALNFQISVLIYAVAGVVLSVVGAIATLGLGLLVIIPVAIGAAIAWLVVVVIAGIKAANGEQYRYPVTIRFVS